MRPRCCESTRNAGRWRKNTVLRSGTDDRKPVAAGGSQAVRGGGTM